MRHIGKTRLDKFDWYETLASYRERPNDTHVVRVFRILELLKGPQNIRTGTELNARLRRYQWHSSAHLWRGALHESLRPPLGLSEPERWEYVAVRELLNLLRERGELEMVHRCKMWGVRSGCEGWFYARPYAKRDRFCSDACKQFDYDSEPKVKARKANHAKASKKNRLNEKENEARQKQYTHYRGPVSRRSVSRQAKLKRLTP